MAAKQIIILDKSRYSASDQDVKACFWFPVAIGQEIPLPSFQSSNHRATVLELQALQNGTVIEEVFNYQCPTATALASIQTALLNKWSERQAQLAAQLNPNQWNNTVYDGTWTAAALARPLMMKTDRRILGAYRCATSLITGAAAAQNLLSIENPALSTISVFIKRIEMQGAVAAIATTLFAYRVGRTTGLPTAGTILTSQKYTNINPTSTAIVRQAPTATAAAGDAWTGTPGVLITAASAFAPHRLLALAESREDDDIQLIPGEGLIVRADINTTNWRHLVSISWHEASGN